MIRATLHPARCLSGSCQAQDPRFAKIPRRPLLAAPLGCQFVTNLRNDMTPELLSIMVDRFNDPAWRPQTVSPEEARVETICEDLDKIPEVSDLGLDDLPGL